MQARSKVSESGLANFDYVIMAIYYNVQAKFHANYTIAAAWWCIGSMQIGCVCSPQSTDEASLNTLLGHTCLRSYIYYLLTDI